MTRLSPIVVCCLAAHVANGFSPHAAIAPSLHPLPPSSSSSSSPSKTTPATPSTIHPSLSTGRQPQRSTNALRLFPLDDHTTTTITTTILLLADETITTTATESVETWRQYVPLGVSLAVITDILLGNPIANLALAPMRRATEEDADTNTNTNGNGGEEGGDGAASSPQKKFVKNPNERVDTSGIGKAAVQKARYSMDLRTFLDENKSQEQKYDDMRKDIDDMARKFDEKIDDARRKD